MKTFGGIILYLQRLPLPSIGRLGPVLTASIILGLVSIWLTFAGIAYESYRTEWQAAELFGGNVAALIEQDIARNDELYDLSIKALVEEASDPAIMNLPVALRRKVLFDRSANASGLGAMLVIDKAGLVIMDSRGLAPPGLNMSDRDYFVAQRDGVVWPQPFVSHPFKSRISQNRVIAFSRPRLAADGSFDGIVVGAMTLDYFAHLFQAVHLPPGSTITLVHRDGAILTSLPRVNGAAGDDPDLGELFKAVARAPVGGFVKRSLSDDVERLVTYRQIGSLPIYLAVGLSTEEFLHHWLRRREIIGLGFVALSLIILFLGIMLARELHRRTLAERFLSELAATDSLTLLANRRRFDETLEIEWRRGIREGAPLSLLMIDGDFFKAFNDTYGHVEGDEALRLVADSLRTCVERPGDLVARFGGEEFVILLPRTDQDGAYRIAQAIKQAVAALAMPHAGSMLGVLTVSIGVASRTPSPQAAASSLVQAADAALYAAKTDGRDRIVVDEARGRLGWRTRPPRVA